MRSRKLLAAATAIAALLPFAAAARAACCLPRPAQHACCASRSAPPPAEGRGCCKTPKAPNTETRAQDRVPVGIATAHPEPTVPAPAGASLPPAPALRLARLGTRAPAADVSPPDLLSRYATLLI